MASSTGSSIQSFLTVLVVNGAIFLVFVALFLFLRKRQPRIYEPRSFIPTVKRRYAGVAGIANS